MIAPPADPTQSMPPRIKRSASVLVALAGPLLLFLGGAVNCGPEMDPASSRGAELLTPQRSEGAPTHELFTADERADLLAAARQLIGRDPVATLITVDGDGRARARSVDFGGPDGDWRFWVATRPSTRKVEQIERLSEVTLHFETDDAGGYVSVMGRARIHREDVALFDAKNPIAPDLMPSLFPDYPKDYLLLEIRPIWLEVLSTEIEASSDTWRPQSVVFE